MWQKQMLASRSIDSHVMFITQMSRAYSLFAYQYSMPMQYSYIRKAIRNATHIILDAVIVKLIFFMHNGVNLFKT